MCFTVQMVVTTKWDPTPQITFMDVFDPLISLSYSTTVQGIQRNLRDQVIFRTVGKLWLIFLVELHEDGFGSLDTCFQQEEYEFVDVL